MFFRVLQERIRPAFLQSDLHCCEHALLVYNTTSEEILEEQRKLLYRPPAADCTVWSRLGAIPTHATRRGVKDIYLPMKRPTSGLKQYPCRSERIALHSVPNANVPGFLEGNAIASFNRKPQKENHQLSRITRKMIFSTLGEITEGRKFNIPEPLEREGSTTHRVLTSRTPRQFGVVSSLPSVLVNEDLIKQLEVWNT